MIKTLGGFVTLYGIILSLIPYYLYNNANYSIFLTYFANVDIVCNVLAINYPHIFKQFYNPDFKTFPGFLSFNAISLTALSGIFIHGIYYCSKNVNKHKILMSLMAMAIITFTLPTHGIPYLTKLTLDTDRHLKEYEIEITTAISLSFIILEWFIIRYLIINDK